MAKQFDALEDEHRRFIARQHVFLAASAATTGRVNLSPKDAKSLRLIGETQIALLDQTGSGNETSAHLKADGRLTFMFCSFDGLPLILRLYGRGRILPRGGEAYASLLAEAFGGEEPFGARQIVLMDIELVQTSCGYGVPLFDYVDERPNLLRWAEAQGEDGMGRLPGVQERAQHRRRANGVAGGGVNLPPPMRGEAKRGRWREERGDE